MPISITDRAMLRESVGNQVGCEFHGVVSSSAAAKQGSVNNLSHF